MFGRLCTVLAFAGAAAAVNLTELPTDFSGTQGYKGWSYERTWGGELEPFTDFGDSWNLPGSYCSISESAMHPNTAGDGMCAAPNMGLCSPSLHWDSSAYQQNYTNFSVTLTASHSVSFSASRDGVALKVYINNNLTDTFETPFDVTATYANVNQFRADLDPKTSCNFDGTSYSVTVDADLKPPTTPTVTPSETTTASVTPSETTTATPTTSSTYSASPTPSSICYIIQRNLFGTQETVSGDGTSFTVFHGDNITHAGPIDCGNTPVCVETANACVCTYSNGGTYACGVRRRTQITYTIGATNNIRYVVQSPSCFYYIVRTFMIPSATATPTFSPTVTPTGMCYTIRTYAHGKTESVEGNKTYTLAHGSYVTTSYLPNFDMLFGVFNRCTERAGTCECTYINGYDIECEGAKRQALVVYKNGPEFQTVVMNESACAVQFNTTFAFPSATRTGTQSVTETATTTASWTATPSWTATATASWTATPSFSPTETMTTTASWTATQTATQTASPTPTMTQTRTATVTATGVCNDVRNYVFGKQEQITPIYAIHHGMNVTHLYYPYNFVVAGGAPRCRDLGSACECVYDNGGTEFCSSGRRAIVMYTPRWTPGFQTVLISDSDPVCVYKFNTTFRIPYLSPSRTETASITASATSTSSMTATRTSTRSATPSATPFILAARRLLRPPRGFPAIPTNASTAQLSRIAGSYVGGLNASAMDTDTLTDTLGLLASQLTAVGGANFSGVSISGTGFAWAAVPSGPNPVPQTVGNVSAVLPPLGAGVVLSFLALSEGGRNSTDGFAQFSISALGSVGDELGVSGLATPLRFVLPLPSGNTNATLECVYWNGTEWDTDGCRFVAGACECTHFTEFSARFAAVSEANANIFANAESVYSVAGFIKHQKIYSTLICLAIGIIITFGILLRMDARAEQRYQICVENIEEVCKVLGYDKPTDDVVQPHLALAVSVTARSWIRRMCAAWMSRLLYQHSYISIFFKYDPRLPRGFRFLFVAVVVFHTLFLSTLFYAYTASGSTMTISETIVLSLITAALNIPFIKLVLRGIDLAGKAEYLARFPAYAYEYARRQRFENALVTVRTADIERAMNKVKYGARPSAAIQPSPVNRTSVQTSGNLMSDLSTAAGVDAENTTEMAAANILMGCVRRSCCRWGAKPTQNGLKIAVEVATEETDYWEAPTCSVFPTKSWAGLFIAGCMFGWIGWCLNYFLLFTSHMSTQTMTDIAASFGISQATSILITQPITLAITLCVLWLIEKYKRSRAPANASSSSHHIGYFADPRYKSTSTTLSGAWAYWIFFYAASTVSIHVFHADVSIGYSSSRVATAWMLGDAALQTVVSPRDSAITALYVYLRGIEKPVKERTAHRTAAVLTVLNEAASQTHVQIQADDEPLAVGVFQKIATDK